MTLNRDDYPDLTDEQWEGIKAEMDRARTQASTTAKKGMLSEREVQERIDAALVEERTRIEASDNERLELDRKKLADEQAAFIAERRSFTAKAKLIEAGIPAEKVDALLPMFVNVDDKTLPTVLETFVGTVQETVKGQVDSTKEALLESATPPSSPTNAPVDVSTVAAERLKAGDEVGALDVMLKAAGYDTE